MYISPPSVVKATLKPPGGDYAVNYVKWTADGAFAVTCSEDRNLYLWNPFRIDSNDQSFLLKSYTGAHSHGVTGVAIAKSNDAFVSCGGDRDAFVWDVQSGKVTRRLKKHTQRVNSVDVSDDKSIALTGSDDGTVKVWDLRSKSREPIQELTQFKDSVTSVSLRESQSTTTIMAGCVDGKLYSFDIRNGGLITDDFLDPICSATPSRDGLCTLCSCTNSQGGAVFLSEMSSGTVLQRYEGHVNVSYRVPASITHDDGYVVSGSEDGRVCVWDLASGAPTVYAQDRPMHRQTVTALECHPGKPAFISASFDGITWLWADM